MELSFKSFKGMLHGERSNRRQDDNSSFYGVVVVLSPRCSPFHQPELCCSSCWGSKAGISPGWCQGRDLTWSSPSPLLLMFCSVYRARLVPSSWQHRSSTTQPRSSKALIWWKVTKGLEHHSPGSTCREHRESCSSSAQLPASPATASSSLSKISTPLIPGGLPSVPVLPQKRCFKPVRSETRRRKPKLSGSPLLCISPRF